MKINERIINIIIPKIKYKIFPLFAYSLKRKHSNQRIELIIKTNGAPPIKDNANVIKAMKPKSTAIIRDIVIKIVIFMTTFLIYFLYLLYHKFC